MSENIDFNAGGTWSSFKSLAKAEGLTKALATTGKNYVLAHMNISMEEFDKLSEEGKMELIMFLPDSSITLHSLEGLRLTASTDTMKLSKEESSLSLDTASDNWDWDSISGVILNKDGFAVMKKTEGQDEEYPYPYPEPPVKLEEKVRAFFRITEEDWAKLTEQERADLVAKYLEKYPYPEPEDLKLEGDSEMELSWDTLDSIIVGHDAIALIRPGEYDPLSSTEADPSWKWDEVTELTISPAGVMVTTTAKDEEGEKESDTEGSPGTDAPRTAAERAMSHFNISKEDWDTLSKEKQDEFIGKLPPRGSGKDETGETLPLHEQLIKEKQTAISLLIERAAALAAAEEPNKLSAVLGSLQDLLWEWQGSIRLLQSMTLSDEFMAVIDAAELLLKDHGFTNSKEVATDTADRPTKVNFRDEAVKITDFTTGDEGMMEMNCVLMRPMVQEYQFGDEVVRILKDPLEIELAAQYADHRWITDDHPEEGYVSSPCQICGVITDIVIGDDGELKNKSVISCEALQKKIEDGKADVSAGFQAVLDWTPGEFNGEKYDAVQREILIDHQAVVSEGRCSSKDGCGLIFPTMDAVGKPIMDQTEHISKLEAEVTRLLDQLKAPLIKTILNISDKKPEEELKKLTLDDLTELKEMLVDGKDAPTPHMKDHDDSHSTSEKIDKAYGC